MPEMNTYQHPVLERGGNCARDGTLIFVAPTIKLRLVLVKEERSSLGAITGNRIAVFFEISPR